LLDDHYLEDAYELVRLIRWLIDLAHWVNSRRKRE
jgi:hypothetical protein